MHANRCSHLSPLLKIIILPTSFHGPHCMLQHPETSSAEVEKRPDFAISGDEQKLDCEKMDRKNQVDDKVKKISCCVRVHISK